ncbi:hypothetical protein [Acidovorax sp. Root267]|uniref:hypothetical protein n=1 Tax=Acidovorax sp. Root267 TaxID=1736505 RepID=UPI000AFDFB79|nr:hypothetical protein [Acidovorax sp. Root267]
MKDLKHVEEKNAGKSAKPVGSNMLKLLTAKEMRTVSGGAWRAVRPPRSNPGHN